METFPLQNEAMQVKTATLQMLRSGVYGSHGLADLRLAGAISLDRVLDYSSNTKHHKELLSRLLVSADPKSVSKYVYGSGGHLDAATDFVCDSHDHYLVYYMTYPFIERVRPFIEKYKLIVDITKPLKSYPNMWDMEYHYSEHGFSPENIAGSSIFPERLMLLQFWFTGNVLSSEEILEKMSPSPYMATYLEVGETFVYRGFTHHQFVFDGARMAMDAESKRAFGDATESVVRNLTFRGKYRFSIVEVGTALIEGKAHVVYTGSERIERIL
jgi:hypothetical protein